MNELTRDFFDFLKDSPSCFHAVENIRTELENSGFEQLTEDKRWKLVPGHKYYVARNGSSLIAFYLPSECVEKGFRICASHSDSPTFKIKENPEMTSSGCVTLNVEKYGGMLLNPWFDRPLSIAGRVAVRTENGFENRLLNFDRNLLMIPSLAIHMNRDANEGHKIDVQKEIQPVLTEEKEAKLSGLIADELKIKTKDIISTDLFLYNRSEPTIWGANEEFISGAKLDDLECAFLNLKGFLSASAENADFISVYAVFDNEEVGSQTYQGAASTFLKDILERINHSLQGDLEENKIRLAKSIMLSTDNAHAVHPNFAEKADPTNRPLVNGGIVIKYNAAQKYTTDAVSSAFFKNLCEKADVPFQIYTNNSNVAGGSTLGNISQSQVSIPCVDIGLAQWAMHSPYESAGLKDMEYMFRAVKAFFS